MGDSDRSPQIQLEIDQEIFIDSVADGDVVEDATVATEVTLFDRVGDAYVLEGAIVFAGYTKNGASEDSDGADEATDALSFGVGNSGVNHLHHRLPFVLRVPVKAQPRGIVNVNSRISSWRLEVIGAGWLRILGDLTILGLNGDKGYHFDCGAQEEGDLFFQQQETSESHYYEDVYEVDDPAAKDAAAGGPHGSASASETESDAAPNDTPYADLPEWQPDDSEELQLTRGSEDDMDVGPAYEDTTSDEYEGMRYTPSVNEADVVSDARGGQEMAETRPAETSKRGGDPENFSSSELHRLDRLFGAQNSSSSQAGGGEDAQPLHPRGSGDAGKEDSAPYDVFSKEHRHTAEVSQETEEDVSDNGENVVEFDFEHQVPDVGAVQEEDVHEAGAASHRSPRDGENVGGDSPDLVMGESMDEEETRAESVPMSSDMWSFVDFDGPDNKYTLRFVIIEDEESLEDVSVRFNCSPEDLMRMNHLSRDTVVHPGQPLAVPESEQQQEA